MVLFRHYDYYEYNNAHSLVPSCIHYLLYDQPCIVRHFGDLVNGHLRNVVVETHRQIAKPYLIEDEEDEDDEDENDAGMAWQTK